MSKLAILGGKPVRKKPFPIWPRATENEKINLKRVIDSNGWGFFRTNLIREFGEKFAYYHGAKYGIPCSNATAALQLQLMSLGIGRGDEIITTIYTCVSTVTAITSVGAVPVFVDINDSDYCMNVNEIERKITSKTKALVPVHLYGSVCDLDRLNEIAKKHNLYLIEDAAQVPGSFYGNKGVGTLGVSGSFSFQEGKVMTSAEGGIIITDRREMYELAQSYSNCGRVKEGDSVRRVMGNNYRMTAFQAAILLGQLELLAERTRKRQENADYLNSKLASIDNIEVMKRNPKVTRQAYYIYVFKFKGDKLGISREIFIKALEAEGIEIKKIFLPLYKDPLFNLNSHDMPEAWKYYKKNSLNNQSFPVAEQAGLKEGLGIRQPILLEEKDDMDDIVNAVEKVMLNIKFLR